MKLSFCWMSALPTLFNLFINDLIEEIKQLNLGVKCGEILVALLMSADDIAIMAETEEDLQCMLNTLHTLCESWQLHINPNKTNIGLNPYLPYLGVWLDEHLDYHNCVTTKSKQFGNFPFEAFSSLYESLVIPRMDQGAGVCMGPRNLPQVTNHSKQGN